MLPTDPRYTGQTVAVTLVHALTADEILHTGALFRPPAAAKPLAVLWVHGGGQNFYYPGYLGIGEAMSGHGYAFLSANTRGHDYNNRCGRRGAGRPRRRPARPGCGARASRGPGTTAPPWRGPSPAPRRSVRGRRPGRPDRSARSSRSTRPHLTGDHAHLVEQPARRVVGAGHRATA